MPEHHPAKKWLMLGAAVLLLGGLSLLGWVIIRVVVDLFWAAADLFKMDPPRPYSNDKDGCHGD